jgi:hypothetical protein
MSSIIVGQKCDLLFIEYSTAIFLLYIISITLGWEGEGLKSTLVMLGFKGEL